MNALPQLSDPYYLWKKSKLECVSQSLECLHIFAPPSIHICPYSVAHFLPVCVGCVLLGHILSQLALWTCYRSELFYPRRDIQDAVVSKLVAMHYFDKAEQG